MKKKNCDKVLVKASTITHAKRGYFVFQGAYPNIKHKYFRSKIKAIEYKNRC